MPCLLREHLLCVSNETGTRLVLDFVLRYYRRFLGLDDARAALLELRWPGGEYVSMLWCREMCIAGLPEQERDVVVNVEERLNSLLRCCGLGLFDCALCHCGGCWFGAWGANAASGGVGGERSCNAVRLMRRQISFG